MGGITDDVPFPGRGVQGPSLQLVDEPVGHGGNLISSMDKANVTQISTDQPRLCSCNVHIPNLKRRVRLLSDDDPKLPCPQYGCACILEGK